MTYLLASLTFLLIILNYFKTKILLLLIDARSCEIYDLHLLNKSFAHLAYKLNIQIPEFRITKIPFIKFLVLGGRKKNATIILNAKYFQGLNINDIESLADKLMIEIDKFHSILNSIIGMLALFLFLLLAIKNFAIKKVLTVLPDRLKSHKKFIHSTSILLTYYIFIYPYEKLLINFLFFVKKRDKDNGQYSINRIFQYHLMGLKKNSYDHSHIKFDRGFFSRAVGLLCYDNNETELF